MHSDAASLLVLFLSVITSSVGLIPTWAVLPYAVIELGFGKLVGRCKLLANRSYEALLEGP